MPSLQQGDQGFPEAVYIGIKSPELPALSFPGNFHRIYCPYPACFRVKLIQVWQDLFFIGNGDIEPDESLFLIEDLFQETDPGDGKITVGIIPYSLRSEFISIRN